MNKINNNTGVPQADTIVKLIPPAMAMTTSSMDSINQFGDQIIQNLGFLKYVLKREVCSIRVQNIPW